MQQLYDMEEEEEEEEGGSVERAGARESGRARERARARVHLHVTSHHITSHTRSYTGEPLKAELASSRYDIAPNKMSTLYARFDGTPVADAEDRVVLREQVGRE